MTMNSWPTIEWGRPNMDIWAGIIPCGISKICSQKRLDELRKFVASRLKETDEERFGGKAGFKPRGPMPANQRERDCSER